MVTDEEKKDLLEDQELNTEAEAELDAFFSGETVEVEDTPADTETVATRTEEPATPVVAEPEEKIEDEPPAVAGEIPEEPKSNDDWKRMRLKLKEREEQIKALESAKAEPEPTLPEVPVPEPAPVMSTKPEPPPPERAIRPETAFLALARAQNGDEAAAQLVHEARAHILEALSPQDIAQVQRVALNNGYGYELSQTVSDLCQQYLPLQTVMWQEKAEQRKAEQQVQAQRKQCWDAVIGEMPELRNQSSDMYKRFAVASGEIQQSVPNLWQSPNAPRVVAEYMSLLNDRQEKTTLAAENAKLKEEVANYKKRLGIEKSAPAGGQPASDTPKKLTPEQELDQELSVLLGARGG